MTSVFEWEKLRRRDYFDEILSEAVMDIQVKFTKYPDAMSKLFKDKQRNRNYAYVYIVTKVITSAYYDESSPPKDNIFHNHICNKHVYPCIIIIILTANYTLGYERGGTIARRYYQDEYPGTSKQDRGYNRRNSNRKNRRYSEDCREQGEEGRKGNHNRRARSDNRKHTEICKGSNPIRRVRHQEQARDKGKSEDPRRIQRRRETDKKGDWERRKEHGLHGLRLAKDLCQGTNNNTNPVTVINFEITSVKICKQVCLHIRKMTIKNKLRPPKYMEIKKCDYKFGKENNTNVYESYSEMCIIVGKIFHKIICQINNNNNNFFMFQMSLTNEKHLIFRPENKIMYSKGKEFLSIQFYVQDLKINIRKMQSTKIPSLPFIIYKNAFFKHSICIIYKIRKSPTGSMEDVILPGYRIRGAVAMVLQELREETETSKTKEAW